MILKVKNGDSWTFIDNVENVTKNMQSELQFSGFINYSRCGEVLTQCVDEGCYLLNDRGQTIEKIV